VVTDREESSASTPPEAPEATERPRPGRPARGSRRGDAQLDEAWQGAEVDPAVAERGLRGLIGGGSSQVSPAAGLRARDAARPRPEDLARAEAELQIVRRHWTPRD
jgi:hypothetical protein